MSWEMKKGIWKMEFYKIYLAVQNNCLKGFLIYKYNYFEPGSKTLVGF